MLERCEMSVMASFVYHRGRAGVRQVRTGDITVVVETQLYPFGSVWHRDIRTSMPDGIGMGI